MLRYALNKLLYGFAVMLGVIVLVFVLFNVMPVDPANLTIGQSSDLATEEAVRKELGLDKPMHVRFGKFLNDISPVSVYKHSAELKSELGYQKILSFGERVLILKWPYLNKSYQTKRPVNEILVKALPQTLVLALVAIVLASIVGIILGVVGAVKFQSPLDNLLTFLSTIGVSVPSFFSAMVIGFILGNVYHQFTGLNQTGSLYYINNLGEKQLVLKNLILPALALGVRPISIIYQLTRSAMLDVLSKDYIRTARAKGLSNNKVIFKHGLRNALNPVVTSITGWFASLLAGAFFVEIIFDIKGIGYITVNAMQNFDFPVAIGAVLVITLVFVLANIIADIAYGLLDPRISV